MSLPYRNNRNAAAMPPPETEPKSLIPPRTNRNKVVKATLTKVNQRNDAGVSAESLQTQIFANAIRNLVQATFRQRILYLHVEAKMLGHGENILVTPTTHIHHDDMVFRQPRRDFHHMGKRVARLQRGDYTLLLAAKLEGF